MIKVGMALTLEMFRDGEREKFKCKVEDVDSHHLYIHYPISLNTGKTAFILNGSKLTASFVDEQSNAYVFQTEVKGRAKNTIPMILLMRPEPDKYMKIQRREFVRIETSADIALEFPDSGCHFATITEDISGGGCAAILPPKMTLREGEFGTIHLAMPLQAGEYAYASFPCKLIRCFSKNNRTLASLQFLNVSEHDQRQLIRFCFERQLANRKKGIPL
ncbi:MAG TPA: flagellar brake domain-containing protein [Bacillaceae bacterium]